MKRFLAKLFGPPGRRRTPHLRLERLDDRDVPATLVWVGSAGGDWSTAANWSTGTVPTSGDQLDFGELSGANTSSVDDITSLTVSEIDQSNTFTGTIEIPNGKTLEVSSSFTAYGTVQVDQGAQLGAGAVYLYGVLIATGPGPSSNPMAPPSPTLDLTLLDMTPYSTFSLGGSTGTNVAIDTLTMTYASVWNVTGTITDTGDVSSAGTINIGTSSASGALTVSGDFSMGGPTALLTLDQGTLTTPGASDVPLACSISVTASGVIDAASVTLSTGEVDIANNALFHVMGELENQSSSIDFGGTLGTLATDGDFTEDTGASLNMQIESTSSTRAFDTILVSGTADMSGSLTVTGTVSVAVAAQLIGATSGSSDFDSTSFPPAPPGLTLTVVDFPTGTPVYTLVYAP